MFNNFFPKIAPFLR